MHHGMRTRPGRGLNLGSWARHALLHMAPECFDHLATWQINNLCQSSLYSSGTKDGRKTGWVNVSSAHGRRDKTAMQTFARLLLTLVCVQYVCDNRWATTVIWAMTRASWAGSRRVSSCWPAVPTSSVTSTLAMVFSSGSSATCRRGCVLPRSDPTPTVLYVYFFQWHTCERCSRRRHTSPPVPPPDQLHRTWRCNVVWRPTGATNWLTRQNMTPSLILANSL